MEEEKKSNVIQFPVKPGMNSNQSVQGPAASADEPKPPQVAQPVLTISVRSDGSIGVNGPLDNKVLCYGLLEVARDTVQAFKPPVPSNILTPDPGIRKDLGL